MPEAECTACGLPIAAGDFYKSVPSMHRACRRTTMRAAQKERKRAIWRRGTAKHRALFPERDAARKATIAAIEAGVLVRPETCSACGGDGSPPARYTGPARSWIEAHHDDYSRPLDVRWLCKQCHEAAHHP